MKNLNKLIETLPTITNFKWDRETQDFIPYEVKPYAFIRDGYLFISAERGDCAASSDNLTVNPKLEQWAKNLGSYWEWFDNGSIVLAN